MATTKIWPVRDNLARVVEYAENHLKTANPEAYTAAELKDLHDVLGYAANGEKTARQFYVTGINCIGEIAYQQMSATKERFGKTGGNLAYHAYQSFAPDEVTPERCHEIGVALAKRIWGDRYEVLVTTHLNTHCVHNHLVVNSVSFVDGKKLDNNFNMYFGNLRAESDRICRLRGLSVIEKPGRSSGSPWMRQAERRGEPTLYNIIKADVDEAIRRSMTLSQLYIMLKWMGYAVNDDPHRKYATIRAPGMQHNVRFKTLGEAYTPEAMMRRLLAQGRPYIPPPRQHVTRQCRFAGSFKTTRKISGFYALYLHYCYLLGVLPKRREDQPRRQALSPQIRAAVRQMHKYSEETRLLCRHRIETEEQLTAFIENRKENLGELERQRGKVYNRMKSAKTPEKLTELKTGRDGLSAQIKVIRQELYYARDIFARRRDIQRQIQTERQLRQKQERRHEKQKTKTIKTREYER